MFDFEYGWECQESQVDEPARKGCMGRREREMGVGRERRRKACLKRVMYSRFPSAASVPFSLLDEISNSCKRTIGFHVRQSAASGYSPGQSEVAVQKI